MGARRQGWPHGYTAVLSHGACARGHSHNSVQCCQHHRDIRTILFYFYFILFLNVT